MALYELHSSWNESSLLARVQDVRECQGCVSTWKHDFDLSVSSISFVWGVQNVVGFVLSV